MTSSHKVLMLLLLATPVFLMTGCNSGNHTNVTFPSGRVVMCELALSQREHVEGLSGYEALQPNQGMLFVYPEARVGLSFWMPARMNFSIDFIFVNEEKEIVYVIRNAPPCESNVPEDCPSYGPPAGRAARYVIEVVAGFCDEEGIRIGDVVRFNLP